MAKNIRKPAPSTFNLGDITYVLFKHKWKIILLSVLSCMAAAAFYWKAPVNYQSQAKLMVRYLIEESPMDQVNRQTDTVGRQTESIINGEMELLTSWDLAEEVAGAVAQEVVKLGTMGDTNRTGQGPISERDVYRQLTGGIKGGDASQATAASSILKNLSVTTERNSNVIVLTFSHTDSVLPRVVLSSYVKLYLVKHLKTHRYLDTEGMVAKEKESSKDNLNKKNIELQDLLSKYGISSVEEGAQRINGELMTVQAELSKAEAGLAEQSARVAAFESMAKGGAGQRPGSESPTPVASSAVSVEVLEKYRSLCARLAQARQSHDLALLKFMPGHAEVQSRQGQINTLIGERTAMEKENPALLPIGQASSPFQAGVDLPTQRAELAAIQARVSQLKASFDNVSKRAGEFAADAPRIASARQVQEVAEESYKIIETSSQKAQAGTLLRGGGVPNISKVQEPTPAAIDTKWRDAMVLGILSSGPILGVCLVLLFGLLLNRSIKRPQELEESLAMPLMMAIPYFSKNARIAQLESGKASALTNGVDSNQSPWDKFHFIKPFAEAIRDRLTMYFDVTGNMRKPKMIAVTGCTVGAGASTIAAGLAASLSEIGEGKVLLVDMSGSQGTAHPFYEGAPALSLSKAIHLPPANTYQGSALPENNLFVVRTESPASGTNCVGLRRMMPELKASEFDYIVFDLPPLGQTRPTALIAGMMDKVLLVVEAEANTRSEVKRGYYDLVDASADIAMIFNKAKQHGPKALVGSSL